MPDYIGPIRTTPLDLILSGVKQAWVFANAKKGYLDCPKCRARHYFENLRAEFLFWWDCECGMELLVEVTR